jgi:hypothetical protein
MEKNTMAVIISLEKIYSLKNVGIPKYWKLIGSTSHAELSICSIIKTFIFLESHLKLLLFLYMEVLTCFDDIIQTYRYMFISSIKNFDAPRIFISGFCGSMSLKKPQTRPLLMIDFLSLFFIRVMSESQVTVWSMKFKIMSDSPRRSLSWTIIKSYLLDHSEWSST